MDNYLEAYQRQQDAAYQEYISERAYRERCRKLWVLQQAGEDLPPRMDEMAREHAARTEGNQS